MTVVHVDFRSRSVAPCPVNYWIPVQKHWIKLNDRLTYKQYSKVMQGSSGKYRESFERVLKFTRKRELRALAEEGIRLCAFAEAADSRKQEACQ